MNKNLKTGLIIGGVLVAVFVIVPLAIGLATGWDEFCNYGWTESGMMDGFGGMMGGFGWFMPVFWLAILGFIIWIVIVATQDANRQQPAAKPESALDIIKERYARGEITKEEFEEKRKDLSS